MPNASFTAASKSQALVATREGLAWSGRGSAGSSADLRQATPGLARPPRHGIAALPFSARIFRTGKVTSDHRYFVGEQLEGQLRSATTGVI